MSPQERIEASTAGRIFLSAFIALTLGAILVSNLRSSTLGSRLFPVLEPYLRATGLEQSWRLFGPRVRAATLKLEARIALEDGTTIPWQPPSRDRFLGAYRTFRWRKLTNIAMSRAEYWPVVAEWLARPYLTRSERVVRVTLVRKYYYTPAPGRRTEMPPAWRENVLYTATLSRRGHGS